MLPCVRFFRKKLSKHEKTEHPITDVNIKPGSSLVNSIIVGRPILNSEKLPAVRYAWNLCCVNVETEVLF